MRQRSGGLRTSPNVSRVSIHAPKFRPMNSLALTRRQAEQISNDLVDRYRQLQISWVSLMNDIQGAIDQGVPAALGYPNYKNWLNIYFKQSAPHLLRQLQVFRL